MILIKTNRLIPKQFDALFIGFGISLIRPEHANNESLIAHEKMHSQRFWRMFILFPILYNISAKHRLQYEAEAYAAQVLAVNENIRGMVRRNAVTNLCTKYNLKLERQRAWAIILKEEEKLKAK